ncbi:zinc finger protein 699-like [Cydia pomonella]|uniref:zinc finger protein 699-like n=1 Tax=Cydia pomonella TaxID=82600 RepID=UPI002ADE800B|nr:zinc finger protein 699-like [Cydia pomonella]
MSSVKKTGGKRPAKQISNVFCCRACLATEGKLVNMLEHKLVGEFFRVTGIVVTEKDRLPLHLCVWCAALMQRCAAFRGKCLRANELLLPLKGELTTDTVCAMDRLANRLVDLTRTNIEVDSIDGLGMPLVVEQPIATDEVKKALYMEIQSFNENEIKINVVKDDKIEEINETEDMFDVEYLDTFEDDIYENTPTKSEAILNENVEVNMNKSETRNRNLNTSMGMKRQRNNNYTGDDEVDSAGRRKKKLRSAENGFLPTVNMEEFKKAFNVDVEILTHEEQLAEIEARRGTAEYAAAPHPCAPCGRRFTSEDAYRHHKLKHDRKEPYVCPVCTIRFHRKGKLWMHLDTHRIKYVCRECGFVSRTRHQARQHHLFHAGKIYTCKYCGKEFRKVSTYLGHVRQRHKTLNVACDMCGETFINDMGLRMHKSYVHGVQKLRKKYRECKTCSVTFISEDALKKHQEAGVHKDGGEHAEMSPCVQCGENFHTEDALKEHADAEHPSCNVCKSTFLNAESYDVHILRKHLGQGDSQNEKRHAANRRALALGLAPPYRFRSRHPQKPIPKEKYDKCCEHCGQMFANSFTLRNHVRKHTGERPFACDNCPKRFDSKGKLVCHMTVHSGEKPYKCELCDILFTRKGNLQKHVRIVHMGIRKNSDCDICGRVFTTPSTMRMHVRTVHNGEPWPKRAPRKKKPQTYIIEEAIEEIHTNSQDEHIEDIIEEIETEVIY